MEVDSYYVLNLSVQAGFFTYDELTVYPCARYKNDAIWEK